MKRLLAVIRRLLAYLLRRPAVLASVDTRMVLSPDHMTLALALHGWGWVSVSPVDSKPRWRDWQFFARGSAHLVVPPGPQARISAINIFGRSTSLWQRPTKQSRVPAVALAPALKPDLSACRPPQLRRMSIQRPPSMSCPRFDLRWVGGVAFPAVPGVRMAPKRASGSTPALSPTIWDRMTLWEQLVKNAAIAAASAVTHTNNATPHNDDSNDNTNNGVDKWDRTK